MHKVKVGYSRGSRRRGTYLHWAIFNENPTGLQILSFKDDAWEGGVSGARKNSGGLMRHLEGDGGDFDEAVLVSLLESVFHVLSGFGCLSNRCSRR